nr:carboxypeptidase-like regulatory domain-containing protein [bacterium]
VIGWLAAPLPLAYAQEAPSTEIWPIRSVDNMKTSRDLARAKNYDSSFDTQIEAEVSSIKALGANYIALGTPYDDEFLPFLQRWVAAARRHGLKVWFRGTFSGYEGWFEYPKDISPDQLIELSTTFILQNPDLFEDGDIFDACPECENAGHWPQPQSDAAYNAFIFKKNKDLQVAADKSGKKIIVNYPSIIGGRVKDVVTPSTLQALGGVATIDHYAKYPANYEAYITLFRDQYQSKTLFGEVGAPIPDLHGQMSEQQQADFMDEVLQILYQNRADVVGMNYWVYNVGTTSLYNKGNQPRRVAEVLKNYFIPGVISGTLTNDLGEPIANVPVVIKGVAETVTSESGYYSFVLPAGDVYAFEFGGTEYINQNHTYAFAQGEQKQVSLQLSAISQTFMYKLKLQWQSLWKGIVLKVNHGGR